MGRVGLSGSNWKAMFGMPASADAARRAAAGALDAARVAKEEALDAWAALCKAQVEHDRTMRQVMLGLQVCVGGGGRRARSGGGNAAALQTIEVRRCEELQDSLRRFVVIESSLFANMQVRVCVSVSARLCVWVGA